GNLLTEYPQCLVKLKWLKSLDLSRNEISSIPPIVAQHHNLVLLNMSRNLISILPDELFELNNLEYLLLAHNRITEVPLKAAQINLYQLDLSCNQIEKIAAEARILERITLFDVSHNPISFPPQDMIRRGSSAFFRYLADEHIIRNNLLFTTFNRHSLNAEPKIQSNFSDSRQRFQDSLWNRSFQDPAGVKTSDEKAHVETPVAVKSSNSAIKEDRRTSSHKMRQVESLPTDSRKRIEDKHKSIINQKDRTENYKASTTSTKTGDGNFAFCDEYHLGEEARRTTKLTAMRGIIKYNLQRMLNKHCQIELNADNIEIEIINGFILCKYIMSFQKNIIQENQLKMPP
ncbi:MAG: hypothetical protein MHMPM18_004208, partial [Marteilia pararefringens]